MSDLLRNSLQYADAEQQALAQQRELEEAQNAWAPIKGFRATRIGMDVNANNMDLAAARAGGRTDQAAQLAAENAQLQQRQGMHAPGIERVEDIGTKNGYLRDGLEWFGTQVGSGVASMAEPMAMAAGGALLSRVPGLRTAAPMAAGLGALAFNQRQVGGAHYGRIAEDEQAMANLGDQGAYQQANIVGALGGAAATAAPWIAGRALGGAALGRAGSAMPGGNFLGKTAFTAGTEGLSEVVEGEIGRTAHTMANPYRDKSGDNSERLNEGLGGMAGGTLPGAAGAAVDTMALGANRTGEAVKDAAGTVRDLATEQGARAAKTVEAAADKANLKQVFDLGVEKGKSVWEAVSEAGAKAKDFMTGEDGRADYVGAFNKAQAEYERFKMDQGERDLLTAVLPEDITDPAAKQAWVDDITQRKDDYLYRKMSELEAQGVEEAGSFLDGLESGDPVVRQTAIEQASEFLLERNSAAELQRQIAANQRLLGEGIAKVAGLATRAARKTGEGAMFAGRAAMKGVADELANKKNKQGTSASLSEPLTYSAWRQIQGDPVVEEMGHAIKRAAEGRRVADATDLDLNILRRRQASQSRAQLFGEIMAAEAEAEASRQEARRGLASRVQTERSVTNPDGSRNIDGLANYARTLAYEISDMAESWAGHERTRDTVRAGTALNVLDAMAKDVRLTLRQSAAPVIQRLSEQADPTTKPFFDALLGRVQRPVSPQAERAARQSVTDQMVALLPQEFQQELLRDGGTEMLFETVGAISRGRVTAGKRREIEEALGTDTVNKLVMAYNGEFATDAGGNPLGETYVDDGLQVMGEGELNDAGEANYVTDDGDFDADGAMGGEISAWERGMKEKTAEMGSGPKIYGLNNDPKARTSPFEPSDKPSKEAVDQYRREERQRHIGMQQPMVRMPQKRPNLFQDEGYDEQGNPIEHRGFKARVAQMEKTLGPDYSIDKRTALEVMDDRKIPTEDRLALYRDYMQAEMLKKDENGNLSEEDRANYEQMIDFISSGMEKARRNPEMWASALRNPRVAMTEEQKRGSGLVKERGNDPDAKMRETLIADMEDYFRSRYMAVAERRIDRDPTSPEAMEVRELTDKARKAVSSIRKNGEDITKANIIWFDTDKRDKSGNVTRVPVRADDLVSWYRKAKAKGEEYSAPDDYSNRTRNESFLKDLGGALAAFVNVPQIKESTVGGPYMEAVGTDGKIRRHQFNEGVPPTLQLETSSYSDYQYGRKNNRRLTPGLGTDAAETKRMAEVELESLKQNTPAFGDGGWKDAPMQEADASNEGTLNPFGDIMAKFTAEQSKTEYTKATERAEDRAVVKAKADEARKQEAAEARKIADDYKALRESLIAERLGNAEQSPATGHLQARAQAQNDARRALPSTEVSPERRAAIEEGVKSSAVAAAAAAAANKKRGTPLTGAALRKQRKHAIAEKVRPLIDERRGGPVTSADPDVLTLKATRIPKNKRDDQVNRKLHREVIASTIGMENGPERRAAERFADSLITDMDRDSEQTIAEKIDLEVRSGGGHKVTAGLGRITKLNAERLSKDHAALMMTKFWHNGDPNDAAGREASFNRGLQGVTNRLRVALAPEYNPDTGVVGGIHYVWPLTHLLTAKMMGDRSKLTPAQSKTLVTARSAVAHAIASHPKLDVAVKMRMLKNMYPEDQRARITTANFMTILNTEAKTYRALLIERAAKANATEAAAAKTTAAPEVAAAEAPKSQSNPGGVGFKLTPRGPFTPKDQLKADRATAFIGRGSADSATNSYANDARAAGIPVNAGKYSASDVVFVSAEGVRTGRLDPDLKEIDRAMSAGATIITDPSDSVAMRRRHNVGERAVKAHLEKSGYVERKPGEWGPGGAGRKFNKQGTATQRLARETLSDISSLKNAMNSLGFRSASKEFSSVAEKLLVAPDEDIDLFLKQSAQGLSYLLMEGETGKRIKEMLDGDYWQPLRVKVVAKLRGMGLMHGEALVAAYREITRMALAKEIRDRNIAARTFVGRVTQMAKDVVSKVRRLTGAEQFQDLVRNSLNELVARNAGPIDLKANYRKVVFQDAVDADPQSARVLASVSRLPGAMLTGSIVLATYGPMYRDAANMLHDLDVLVPNRTAAQKFLTREFPNAVQVYDFKVGNAKIDTYIVPPPGTEVQNIVREYGDKGRVQGYEVVRNGEVVGKMWNDKEGEHKSGEAATLVDLMSEHKGKAAKLVPFKVDGKTHHMTVADASHIFDQKLRMLRPKDIGDYRRFVPDAGRKFNKQGAGKPESEQIVDGVVDRMREYYPDMTDGELRQMAIDNLDAMGETSELGRQYQAALAAEAEAGQQDGMTDETSPETPADGPEGLPEPPQDTGEGQGAPKAPRKPRKKGAGGRKKPGHELVAQDDPPAPSPEQTTAIALRVAEPRATDEDIQKARDYVKRVLGDQVRADFEEITGYSGEWIEAEDVIKISTLTNAGILNVTRHEALHAFFSKFIANNPKAVAVFRSLTDDPRIISRLEYLLRDEPAALEQLADGEERLAYIYQFAMAGQLKLPYSPGKTLMEKVRKFLRRVFMMVRNDERAIDLLYAFERGEFNTPSAGTRALARHLDQGTWMTKGARTIDGFSQWTAAAVLPAATILQNSASPTARKLARVLVTNPGEDGSAAKGHGYLNDRNMRMRQYNNLFRGAIDGLDAGQMTELVEVMQRETPDDAVTDPDVLKARQHLRVLFDRFHKYMTKEKGVRLGRIKENYFPVVWDANKLRENPEGFKGMLLGKYRGEIEKIVASLEEARQKWISRAKTPEDRVLRETTLPVSAETYVQSIYDSIIGNEGVDDAMARSPKRQDGVLRPWMSAAEKRLLDFIKPEDRAPFMEKDLIHIVTRYVRQGVRTAEYTSRFGRTGARLARALQAIEKELNEAGDKMVAAGDLKDKDREKWVKRQYRDVANAVGAMEGSLGNDVSDTVRKINSWAIVYQNVRVLPLALFSSFVDPLGIVVSGGEMRDAWSAFTRGIKSVVGQWGDMLRDEAKPKQKDHWEKLAELAGVIDSATFSHLLTDEYASVYLDGRAKKINEFMFKANGMEAWNRSMRISATKTAVKFMEAHNKGESVHSERWMRNLGFEPGQLPLDVDGNLITNKRVMMSQFPGISEDTAEAMVEKVHKAINRWVEGAILSPNASQRPAWGSDPRFSMFWHLKQFAYSFHETILKRAVGEAKQGNAMPLGVLAWYIPTMIVADVVKGMAINGGSLPDYMKGYDMSDWMMHGIDRSGVLGAGNVALDGVQDPWGIAGPAVEQIADSFTNPLQQSIINALPANALYKGALI